VVAWWPLGSPGVTKQAELANNGQPDTAGAGPLKGPPRFSFSGPSEETWSGLSSIGNVLPGGRRCLKGGKLHIKGALNNPRDHGVTS
jgi:hypothetical protein